MATMQVEIVSAEEEIFSGEAEMVVAPAEMGDVGIMPRHTPLITRLRPGEVKLQTGGQEDQFYFVSGGVLEVQPYVVTVLADTAFRAKDLDEAQAQEAKRRAEEALADKQSDIDYATAQARLAEAAAQLRMLENIRKRRR
ncbi:MAG TPA: F0F1 ATP synthase subunit epsilon [Gammaproteobacteria bacterium]|nr:F0F1 ATP synthase subunit epsilon [Gammaproteobacteria bacterium]HKH21913.1 F0F1 ATP synthase subunit epsilon [Gammaproteobacteria bacterium]